MWFATTTAATTTTTLHCLFRVFLVLFSEHLWLSRHVEYENISDKL